MGKIKQLHDSLSNKIAAGEVVERPASIVKELVENAIDANSSHILVEIEEGGLSSIRIVDNGDGMENDDVETAFLRHATSKIQTDRDLFHIKTLGFRGEALPSIASVAHLTLKTSTGIGAGTEIKLEGGEIVEKTAAATRKGTEIKVTHLFFNTPARLKYLKTVTTEAGNVSDIMNRLAMAHPNIAFELFHDGKLLLKTLGNGDRKQVIAAIYGRNIAKEMLEIKGETLDYSLHGFVCRPEITRASRQYISIIVNGRYIRNFVLAKAIQAGYHTLLPIGRFPIVVLSIEMDPLLIDVNVHPAKLEVRLSKEAELSQLITESVVSIFKKQTLIPEANVKKATKLASEQLSLDFETKQQAQINEIGKEAQSKQVYEPFPQVDSYQTPSFSETKSEEKCLEPEVVNEKAPQLESSPFTASELSDEEERGVTEFEQSVKESERSNLIEQESVAEQVEVQQELEPSRVPILYPVGQMHGTYIIAQNEHGMYLIDQHAAQERIKYEFFREKVKETEPNVQDLLVPFTIECTQQEMAMIVEHIDKLRQVGVFLEEFGPHTFIVRSHPTWLPKGLEEETIREIIEQLLSTNKVDIGTLREEAAILMSCKAAIKANRHLRHDEIFALLETLRKSSDPFTCPHGRPILIHFSTYELEKMFKRVM
ncbi:DNA mismatch repair protein MutL [Alkalihalobacillus alcalophilus ATCC 27647 = CGMCC 1.3604]|uniref:DNA mismatch repair protein MutL n=1 Tax=Alkalihalobacillus alcalophilus ATCC 27647 = CGMCC 1.3604 TaxID=1218173 RepID=A0A094YYA0_ALKAL|nr:DNA mismatch repair endonuclease MutL [Alkalihalobacillus alcalophilus]KGA98517.1 DNA mismatch repair protein MutL [Alkalihalobacillus alcalophilus ATCC 27647 = CGMCC 1.3604]MED1562667.1 DNA mismatch repair endonuclease MutL [Alkalihalobacillus alcalophilus]THG90748.1 DNA mismatch repair protein MutL [Alkalihalobacillus alcalophilus ATCC 27647 = CGMCC 1.3604]